MWSMKNLVISYIANALAGIKKTWYLHSSVNSSSAVSSYRTFETLKGCS